MTITWIRAVLVHRWTALVMAAGGLSIATALTGVLALFAFQSSSTMTQRALMHIPVDWQLVVAPGWDSTTLAQAAFSAVPVTANRKVGYAAIPGLQAVTAGTTQTTGVAMVLGIPADYGAAFPGQIRLLSGGTSGVLLAQQTAANLHASVGQTVSILNSGGKSVSVTVDGIVDLPNANALFQAIGQPKGAVPVAPPDNVLILPFDRWQALFTNGTGATQPGALLQIHARLDHARLPHSPEAAYAMAAGYARHAEVATAGGVQIGDNLAARLDAVKQDGLFATLMLAFLGLPGVVLAVLLTLAVLDSQADRRRQEAALLRLRGASTAQITKLALAEAGLMALVGALAGTLLAAAMGSFAFGADLLSIGVLLRLAGTATAGLIVALGLVMFAIWRNWARTIVASRAMVAMQDRPLWRRTGLDIVLIAVALVVLWHAAHGGYQLVVAPEGTVATAVDTTAFLAPLFLWIGAGLLVLRLTTFALERSRGLLRRMLEPSLRRFAWPIASAASRQATRVASGIALAALAVAFSTSVAIFSATYDTQALVDARLTNGADVTITGTAVNPAGGMLDRIRQVPGVAVAEPMQHRFAFVGSDLQDLYGIDPAAIGRATTIADAYVANRDAAQTLQRLAAAPDGILVSQETVNDYQLSIGDPITLRIKSGPDHAERPVPFHLVGIVSEFPTAPHDSFLVANAAYLASTTGNAQAELVLARADGDPASAAAAVRSALGPNSGLVVTDVTEAGRAIGSSLTAVDLHGLARILMGFGVALAAGCTGLVLALGLAERRQEAMLLAAIGASRRQTLAPGLVEGSLVLAGGAGFGILLGEGIALVLVRLLGGAFDPPPDALQQAWSPVAVVLLAIAMTLAVAVRQGQPATQQSQ